MYREDFKLLLMLILGGGEGVVHKQSQVFNLDLEGFHRWASDGLPEPFAAGILTAV